MKFSPPTRAQGAKSGANRRRAASSPRPETFERQADAAAARVLRPSERTAAQALTRAPAARAPTRDSPGNALPSRTRTLLEERFGADLGAVRIHTDALAADAALDAGALAFAAGRDVYFARGAFSPDTPSGLQLIAHEVAHVLQQTGRRDDRGVVHVTTQEGEGALQFVIGTRFPKSAPRLTLAAGYGDNKYLNALIADLEKNFKNSGLTLAVDWLLDQINTFDSGVFERSSRMTALDELVKQIKAGVDGGRGPARSFVVEVLAMTNGGPSEEYWKAAANVLWRDEEHDLVSEFWALSNDFREWLRKNRNDDYFARSLSHPRIQPWFDDLFRSYVELLVDPRADPARELRAVDGTTGVEQSFAAQVKALNDEILTRPTLSMRDAVAMNLLNAMDAERINTLKAWSVKIQTEKEKRKAQGKLVTGFDVRLIAARLAKDHFEASKWTARAKIFQDFAAKAYQLATNAEETLKRGLALYEKQRATVDKSVQELTVSDAATKFAGGVVRSTELDQLEALLDKHSAKLFDKPNEAGPPPVAYDAAVVAFKLDVEKLYGDLELLLVEKLVTKPDEAISTTNIFVLVLLDELRDFLEKNPYKLAEDQKDKAELEVSFAKFSGVGQAEDLRRFHRHLSALFLLRIGLFAGLGGVAKKASDMVLGDGRSRLLILEDWKESDEPVSRMLVDFQGDRRLPIDWTSAAEEAAASAEVPPRQPQSVRVPFSVAALVNFYSLMYLQTINSEVEKVLQATYANPIDKKTTYSLDATRAAAKSLKRPKRWTPGKYRIFINPKDPLRYTISDLIHLSGKTKYQVKRDTLGAFRPPHGAAFPAAPVFMWVIPDLTPMVTFLRANVALLDKLIAEKTGKNPPAAVDDWIYELGKITDADFMDSIKVHDAIRAALVGEKVGIKFEQQRLLKKSRDLSALRRQLIKARAADLLIQWKNRPRGGMAGKIAFYKEQALQMVRDYRGEVEPWTDAEAQSAALWLDLGPTLDQAFPDGEDIPPDILPRIVMAIEAAKQQTQGRPTVKNPLDAPVMIEDIIGRGGESVASIVAGQTALESVQQKLVKYLESQQEKTGFYAEDNRLKTWRYAASFGVKGEFSWDNRNYRVKAIHRTFAYHPPIGGVPSKLKESNEKGAKDIPRDTAVPLFTIDIDDENAPLGRPTPRSWALAGPSAEGIPEERAKRRTLPKLTGKETSEELEERSLLEEKYKEEEQTEKETGRYVVTSADDKLLNVIGFAVELAAMNEDLQQTGEAIGGFMDVVVTALEIILPGGQVIALAEMLAGAVQTVTDPAMIELIENVRQDPKLIIELLWERIKSLVSFEGIWDILFDEGLEGLSVFAPFATIFDDIRGKRKQIGQLPKSSSTTRAKPRGRLGRVVAYIIGLGKRFLRALRQLKLKFKGPLNRIRSAIITRPRLAWLLVRAISLLKAGLELAEAGFDWVKDVANDAKTHFTEFVKFFSEMTLPGELVPLDQLYGWVLSFILGKIPKVKLIKPLLDAAGWTDKIAGKIIEWIGVKGSWADPNQWWKDMLLPKLEPHFTEIKLEFVQSMLGLINDFGQLLPTPFTIELPTEGDVGKGGPSLVSEEELQELSSGDPPLAAELSLPQDSGRTLDSSTRRAAESHFGQDFGHVRVHDDASTSVFTTALGAEAATSGSHIYLGPNATPSNGSATLHHELGHVIQQTGSRPLGGAYSDAPVRGASGRGINYDAGQEAAADHLASHGAAASQASAGNASLGIQPKFSDALLKKVVNSITRFAPGGAQFKAAAGADTPGVDRAKQVWKDLVAMLSTKKATFEAFISDPKVVRPAVINRITTPIANKDVASVAAMAQKKVPGQTTPTGDPVTTLNPGAFITLLEGFVFARTGVAMQIDAEHDKGSTLLKKLKVYYVHLPLIPYATDAGRALWDRVMETKGLVTKADGSDGKTKIRHLLNGQLSAKSRPEPFIWDLSDPKFQLSASYVKQFRALLDASRGRDRPQTVDAAKDYAETELSKNKSQSGLRVATHGELTQSGHPERSDRDSHHVPQFLLVEFFRNRNSTEKAWPAPPGGNAADTNYGKTLGMVKSSKPGLIDSVKAAGSSFRLKDPLDKNESERGVGLPAVLLAAETHQKGPLHLDDQPDETGDRLSQAEKIKKKWKSYLPSELAVDDVKTWNDNIKKAGVAAGVASAMKKTYRWLYKEVMMPGLQEALRDMEKPYYEGLASERGHVDSKDNLLAAYELKSSMINNVVKKVEDKNTAIMTDW